MVVGLQQHFSGWEFGLEGAVEEVMGHSCLLGKGFGDGGMWGGGGRTDLVSH